MHGGKHRRRSVRRTHVESFASKSVSHQPAQPARRGWCGRLPSSRPTALDFQWYIFLLLFKDPMTTAAAIDRLVHHSVILELNVSSYRAEQAKKSRPAPPGPTNPSKEV